MIDYKVKLKEFNATAKYKRELRMMASMLSPQEGEVILDYGCGIGTALDFMRTEYPLATYFGFDPYHYPDSRLPDKADKVYFMHSFAHIPDVENKVFALSKDTKRFVVLTPNYEWLKEIDNPGYKPDTTVIKHWTQAEIKELFEANGYNTTVYHMGEPSRFTNNRERLLVIADKK